jgi:hypothetical protein
MAGDKKRKRDDGKRKDKKQQNASQDVAARKAGMEDNRPRTKGGAPRAKKAGRQTSR